MSGKLERGAAVFRARFWPGFGPGSGPGYIWSTYACVCLDLTIDRYRRCFLGRERPAPGIYILHIRMDSRGLGRCRAGKHFRLRWCDIARFAEFTGRILIS